MTTLIDIESLLEDLDTEFDPPLSKSVNISGYAQKILANASLFSLYEKGRLAGFAAIYANNDRGKVAYLTMLAVARDSRKMGIAGFLMQASFIFLRNKEYDALRLEVYRSNSVAIEFYKKLGFLITSEKDNSLLMEIDLR